MKKVFWCSYRIGDVLVLYIAAALNAVDEDDADEGLPHVTLTEMLDDLHIADDATGAEGAAMME